MPRLPRSAPMMCPACRGRGTTYTRDGRVLCVRCAGTGTITKDLGKPFPTYKGYATMVTAPLVFAARDVAPAPHDAWDWAKILVLLVVCMAAIGLANEFIGPDARKATGQLTPGVRAWWRRRRELSRAASKADRDTKP